MAKETTLTDAEAFVRRVLNEVFKQKADAETIRAVAEKVSGAIASGGQKEAAVSPKKAA